MTRAPEVGLLIPPGTGWDEAAAWGRRAEEAGAARLWAAEDCAPAALLGGLARLLSLRLGAVVRPGACPPALLAKQLTSLDVICGGRLDVAVEEGPGADGVLAVLAGMAGGEPFHSEGPVPVAGARCLPPSVQKPAFPLWRAGPPGAELPAGMPEGWAEAGLATVAVTPW